MVFWNPCFGRKVAEQLGLLGVVASHLLLRRKAPSIGNTLPYFLRNLWSLRLALTTGGQRKLSPPSSVRIWPVTKFDDFKK